VEKNVTVLTFYGILHTAQWYQSVGDNTLADAILDRLLHNAYKMKLEGKSMRKKQAKLDLL
jgi:DNA replication protein DnaC